MAQTQPPFSLFYSYASEDEAHRVMLEKHLALLRREGLIGEWHFRKIAAGSDWAKEIDEHLSQAKIILLLISADFINSDYCFEIETQKAMKMHHAGDAIVIPIIVRACDWKTAPFGKLQALPSGAVPVTSWPNTDEAWSNVAAGIRRAIALDLARPEGTTVSVHPTEAVPQAAASPSSQGIGMGIRQSGTWTHEGVRFFRLEVSVSAAPEDGYVGWQSLLQCGDLQYLPDEMRDEFLWPFSNLNVAVRSPNLLPETEGLVLHGVLSGLLPPLPRSDYVGSLLKVTLECRDLESKDEHEHKVLLLNYSDQNTNGSGLMRPEGGLYHTEPASQENVPGLGATDLAARIGLVCNPALA